MKNSQQRDAQQTDVIFQHDRTSFIISKWKVSEDIVWHEFIQALPTSIKLVIASQTNLETDHLGKMVDNLLLYFNKQEVAQIQCCHSISIYSSRKNNCPSSVHHFNKNQKPKIYQAHILPNVQNMSLCLQRDWKTNSAGCVSLLLSATTWSHCSTRGSND